MSWQEERSLNLPKSRLSCQAADDAIPLVALHSRFPARRVLSVTHMQLVLNANIVLNANTDFDRSKMERRRLEAIRLDESERCAIAAAGL
jgi:hypothetical protein